MTARSLYKRQRKRLFGIFASKLDRKETSVALVIMLKNLLLFAIDPFYVHTSNVVRSRSSVELNVDRKVNFALS